MRGTMLFLLALFIPLVVSFPAATAPSNIDPEVARYAATVQGVWQSYQDASAELGRILAKLVGDPLLIREASFEQEIKAVTWNIRQTTNFLASVSSPPAVKTIHEDLVYASDIFDAAAYMLDRFAEDHDFDDFANAYELLRAGLGLWQKSIADLTALVGTPTGP